MKLIARCVFFLIPALAWAVPAGAADGGLPPAPQAIREKLERMKEKIQAGEGIDPDVQRKLRAKAETLKTEGRWPTTEEMRRRIKEATGSGGNAGAISFEEAVRRARDKGLDSTGIAESLPVPRASDSPGRGAAPAPFPQDHRNPPPVSRAAAPARNPTDNKGDGEGDSGETDQPAARMRLPAPASPDVPQPSLAELLRQTRQRTAQTPTDAAKDAMLRDDDGGGRKPGKSQPSH